MAVLAAAAVAVAVVPRSVLRTRIASYRR